LFCYDVTIAYKNFLPIVNHLIAQSIPRRNVKTGPKDPPYITPLVKSLLNKRRKFRRAGRLSEANVLAERINHLIGQYHSNSLARLTDATPKQLWAAVRPKRSKGVDFLGGLLKNADSGNKYFASIATNISYSIDNVVKYKTPDISLHPVEEYISCYEVERLLRLQKNTSPGCDLLPSWLTRSCSFELASLAAHIYNCSIHSGIVPISWHTAIVTPVPKVSAPASLNDYRPISVTPILS